MTGALDGLLVADFSRVLAGPYATMLLGDLGATVVKVERPGTGDDTRSWAPPVDTQGDATYFLSVNRNKYSIALDLDDPHDRERAVALTSRADIVIENFPSGALDRRSLGYQEVMARNPSVIYCSITGFGAEVDLPGYDLLVQAVGGLMDITGADSPTKVGVAIVDIVTGLHALTGILAALHHRDRTGEGQHVEVTLLGSLLSALANQSGAAAITGESPSRMGNAHPSIAPYEPYETADRPIIIAVGNDEQFARLCTALGFSQWAQDPRFCSNSSRVAHRKELNELITQALSAHGADVWQERLTQVRVPCGPINSVTQGLRFAEQIGLDPITSIDGVQQITNPVRYSATPAQYDRRPPRLNEHADFLDALMRDN